MRSCRCSNLYSADTKKTSGQTGGGFVAYRQIRKALLLSPPSIDVARMPQPLKFMGIFRYVTLLSNSDHINGFIGDGQIRYNWHRFWVSMKVMS